jgi:hypothetical protein
MKNALLNVNYLNRLTSPASNLLYYWIPARTAFGRNDEAQANFEFFNRLEAKGWKIGSAADFLGLSDEETAYIELKLKPAKQLKQASIRRDMT